jgi:hypothetical protein
LSVSPLSRALTQPPGAPGRFVASAAPARRAGKERMMNDRSNSIFSRLSPAARNVRALSVSALGVLSIAGMLTFGVSPGHCQISCKPLLKIDEVRFSEVRSLQRIWTAVLLVDTYNCATSHGRFDIDFIRLKETAGDMQFTKQLTWTPGRIEVSVDFWADEAVLDYRIGFVAPCVCRD